MYLRVHGPDNKGLLTAISGIPSRNGPASPDRPTPTSGNNKHPHSAKGNRPSFVETAVRVFSRIGFGRTGFQAEDSVTRTLSLKAPIPTSDPDEPNRRDPHRVRHAFPSEVASLLIALRSHPTAISPATAFLGQQAAHCGNLPCRLPRRNLRNLRNLRKPDPGPPTCQGAVRVRLGHEPGTQAGQRLSVTAADAGRDRQQSKGCRRPPRTQDGTSCRTKGCPRPPGAQAGTAVTRTADPASGAVPRPAPRPARARRDAGGVRPGCRSSSRPPHTCRTRSPAPSRSRVRGHADRR